MSSVPTEDPELAHFLAAVRAGHAEEVARLLGARPALAKARGSEGQTALHVAAQCDDPRLGALLLAHGADPNAVYGDSSHTPLSWAVTCNAMGFARAMVELGTEPDLYCAAGIGSLAHVRASLDDLGRPRPGAVRSGSSRTAPDGTRLASPPSDPSEQVSDALYAACRNGHPEVVQFLLTARPDLSFRAYMGGTPLHWAYFSTSQRVVEMLLAAGADVTARDTTLRCTARAFGICAPASWGFAFLVRRQLDWDPALAAFMDGHTSALHEAARAGHVDVIALLLGRGAPLDLRDGQQRTPLDVAEQSGHTAAATLLHSP